MANPLLNPLRPSLSLLCKLGSIVVHVEEALSGKGHAVDYEAIAPLLRDAEGTAVDTGYGRVSAQETVNWHGK